MFEETPIKPAMHSSDAFYGALLGSFIAFILISSILFLCKELQEMVINFLPVFSHREWSYMDVSLPILIASMIAGANGVLNGFILLPFFRKIWRKHDDRLLLWATSGATSGLVIALIFLITGSLTKGVFAPLTFGIVLVCCFANAASWPLSRYISWRRWKRDLYQTYTSSEATDNQSSYAPSSRKNNSV